MKNLIARVFFPLVMVLGVMAVFWLHRLGLSPALATTLVLVPVVALVFVLERLWPFDARWNESQRDVGADVGFAAIVRLPDLAAGALGQGLAVAATTLRGSTTQWPWWLQFSVILVIADVGKYWLHRLSHEREGLWRFHAVHHAPSRVYVLNGLRIHPVNIAWLVVFDVTLPVALGIRPEVMMAVATLRGLVAIFQHANLPLQHGFLNLVFSTNALHRFHHSTVLSEGNSNYGSTLIVWDLLFGTYTPVRERESPAAIGLANNTWAPRSMLAQLVWPFCGERLETQCFSARVRAWLLR